jgi:GNAT superfamily N-acetyltransferase
VVVAAGRRGDRAHDVPLARLNEILARFDAELRVDPPPRPGVRHERAGGIVRAIEDTHEVVYAALTAATVDAAVAAEIALARAGRRPLEWKVYGHDRPPDLGARLAAAGFEPEEPETLMIFDLDGELRDTAAAAAAAFAIRRVADAAGLEDVVMVSATAFDREAAWQLERIGRDITRLEDPALAFYVAYAGERPVASARAEFPPERSFAGLWGGGTVSDYRGRGIYRALVHARAAEARRRGYRYLRVEARETSRPILERLGFVAMTPITEWRLRA